MSEERRLYHDQLRTSHEIHTRVAIHDRDERFQRWVSLPILGGQVDIDVDQTPERTLELTLADPFDEFSLGRAWADNFISVDYGIDVEALDKRVWAPVFFGPITRLAREAGQVKLQAASKEVLLIEPVIWGRYIKSAGLTPGDIVVSYVLRKGHSGTNNAANEVQQIIALAPVQGGTFRIEYDGEVTGDLQWDDSASTVQAALVALSNVTPGDIDVSGGPLPKPFTLRFGSALAATDVPLVDIRDHTVTIDDDIRYAARFLRTLLRETGEHRFGFANFANKRLPKNFKLPKEPESVWVVAKKIVAAVNENSHVDWRLFYDGSGVLRVENMAHGFRFDERVVLNQPSTVFAMDTFRNTAIVSVNRGNESRPVAPVIKALPAKHPLSPRALSRNTKKRFIVERIDNTNVRTPGAAAKLASAQLHRLSTNHVEATFDSLVIPIVVPGSECSLVIDDFHQSFHLDKFSLPLTAEDSMSVGYHRRMKTRSRRPLHV